jgi:hypothetical protein
LIDTVVVGRKKAGREGGREGRKGRRGGRKDRGRGKGAGGGAKTTCIPSTAFIIFSLKIAITR